MGGCRLKCDTVDGLDLVALPRRFASLFSLLPAKSRSLAAGMIAHRSASAETKGKTPSCVFISFDQLRGIRSNLQWVLRLKVVPMRMHNREPKQFQNTLNNQTDILTATQAGLSDEERREIDAAISPGVIAAAAAAAVPAARAEDDSVVIGRSDKGGMVDVGRLLDLCGLTPSPPPARTPSPRVDDRGEVTDCSPRVGLDVASGRDSAEEGLPASSKGEDRGRRRNNPEGDGTDAVLGEGAGGGGRSKGRAVAAVAAAAVAMDENALRRVTHQADLFGRLLVRTAIGHIRTRLPRRKVVTNPLSALSPQRCPLVWRPACQRQA